MNGTLLRQSELIIADGSYDTRVVLRFIEPKNEYVTHMMAVPNDGEPFYVHGNYFTEPKNAHANFEKRLIENGTTESPITTKGTGAKCEK